MDRRLFILIILLISGIRSIQAQTAIITDDVTYTTGNASSVLDIKSTSKGLLIPRVTLSERNSISNAATGLLVFQTDNTPGYYYYNGSLWALVGSGTSSDGSETKLSSGTNITLSGSGTSGSPYLISYSAQSVTQTQRNAIGSPYAGQFVWCNNCGAAGEFQVFNGVTWTNMCGGAASSVYPSVSTASASSITQTTATSGGIITDNGGATVTLRGVCWSTSPNPTTSNTKTVEAAGAGSFVSSLTGLTAGTVYYVRAYATNSDGTFYGAQISFTTSAATVPTITTNAITNITETSARSGGDITSNGGAAVTVSGICWNTSPNPTTSNSKTTDGPTSGYFISDLTGLTAATRYYVRAYATNSAGTAYGAQYSFISVIIGSNYEGGKVAYILVNGDLGYVAGEMHGLIADVVDQNANIQWYNGSNVVTSATGQAIGTGNANTNSIVATQGAGTYAARVCYDLNTGSKTDWYLPSVLEMNKLTIFATATAIGLNTSGEHYWSSTEYSSSEAYRVTGNSGTYTNVSKSFATYSVRCLRSF